MPANLAKVFLKVINVCYQEPSIDNSDFDHQDENYTNFIFCWLQIYQ